MRGRSLLWAWSSAQTQQAATLGRCLLVADQLVQAPSPTGADGMQAAFWGLTRIHGLPLGLEEREHGSNAGAAAGLPLLGGVCRGHSSHLLRDKRRLGLSDAGMLLLWGQHCRCCCWVLLLESLLLKQGDDDLILSRLYVRLCRQRHAHTPPPSHGRSPEQDSCAAVVVAAVRLQAYAAPCWCELMQFCAVYSASAACGRQAISCSPRFCFGGSEADAQLRAVQKQPMNRAAWRVSSVSWPAARLLSVSCPKF